MGFNCIEVTRQDTVATVKLNRPEKLNALNYDIMLELYQAAEQFHDDTQTRAIVFTGEGRYFSSGADLTDPGRASAAQDSVLQRERRTTLGQRLIKKLLEINQITIAAIKGGALGGGACIVSALDFRIGADNCYVSYPEINLGMSLAWYGLPLCVHLVGPSRAKRLVILGNRESADTLLEWGFLDEVVPEEALLERAMELAHEYASQPPIAAQMIKRSVNAISSALDQSIMHMDIDQLLLTHSTEDFVEGIAAYREQRVPEFKGR